MGYAGCTPPPPKGRFGGLFRLDRIGPMENWIGIGIWVVMGMVLGLVTKGVVKLPEETPGHTAVLAVIGGFGAVVGGMLGVGIFHFYEPVALSVGGMASAALFAFFMAWVYRWGVKGWA